MKKLPRRYKIAAVLMIIHGGIMELGSGVTMLALSGNPAISSNAHFGFIVPYLQSNMPLMFIMGGIFGTVRLVGAISLLKNKLWGLVLSVINCVVTMALMIFMLPAGIVDGVLACTALILILIQYYSNKKICE
jgi:hypothetical protein